MANNTPVVYIFQNKFSENTGCGLFLDETIRNYEIQISKNKFVTNLFDIFCNIHINRSKVLINSNVFKIAPDSIEKSVKIGKRFKNLRIENDNEFLRVSENEGGRNWMKFFGCLKNEVKGIEDMEGQLYKYQNTEENLSGRQKELVNCKNEIKIINQCKKNHV